MSKEGIFCSKFQLWFPKRLWIPYDFTYDFPYGFPYGYPPYLLPRPHSRKTWTTRCGTCGSCAGAGVATGDGEMAVGGWWVFSMWLSKKKQDITGEWFKKVNYSWITWTWLIVSPKNENNVNKHSPTRWLQGTLGRWLSWLYGPQQMLRFTLENHPWKRNNTHLVDFHNLPWLMKLYYIRYILQKSFFVFCLLRVIFYFLPL